ncbi:KxYKxGKxW signal peptide domain-containing protein, partial [Pediococcus argentinicus]
MEMKKRFKMYKDGKRWVIGLASAAFIMGLGVASNTASADQVKNNTDNSLELVDGVNKGSIDVDNKQSQQDTNSIKNKTDDSTNSESQTSSLSNPDIKSSNEESKNEKQEALDQQDNNNVNATPENKDSSDVENKTISDATNKVDKPMESSNTDSSDNSISGSSQNDESTPVNMPASSGHVYSDPETVKKFLIWQSIPSKNGDGTINPYAPIIINWNWELGDLKKGDTVNFNIDTTLFTIANDTSAPILTSDGTSVGTFSVTKGGDASVLLSDPSDYFASHTGVNGLLNLITKASEKVVNTPGGEFTFNTTIAKTPFTVSNDSSGTVKDKEYLVKFSTNVGDKWVSPDGTVYESDITTGKIHWHTDINSIKDSLENVSVIDSPEDTQKIDFSSLIVTKFDENGIAKLVSSDQYVLNQTDGGGFTLQLGNITDHYGIDYMSNLVDINGDGMFNDDSQVTNTISLTGNHPVTSQVDTFINTSASGNAEGNTPTTPPTVPTTPPTVPTTPPTVPTTPPTVPTTPPTVPT